MPMAEVPNLAPAMPEIFLGVSAMVLLMLGVFNSTAGNDGVLKASRMASGLGVVVLVLSLALVITVSGEKLITFDGMFVSDPFSTFAKALILLASTFSLILAQDWMEKQGCQRFEYVVVILFATLGMMMMVSSNSLISLYMGLELQSLSLYILAAYQRDEVRSTESGLKYFVLGALASGMLLYGSSLVYGFSGTLSFDMLAEMFNSGETPSAGLVVGLVFIMAGLAFKVSAVPFHMWTPDVYEGAPTPITAFFSVAPKVAALALFIRVMSGPFGGLSGEWQQIVVVISVASMILGAFGAIAQINIKRMMAYSSIGHVGYALIGLAVANEGGVRSILVYIAIYVFMNIGTFACIISMRRDDRSVENIYDLAGLSKSHPGMAAALSIFMFSMAGIPPLAGFIGKFYIFMSAVEAGLYTLAILGVLSSVVGAFYYIRIVKIMYFDKATSQALDAPLAKPIVGVLVVSTVFILGFIAFPNPIIHGAEAAASSLFLR